MELQLLYNTAAITLISNNKTSPLSSLNIYWAFIYNQLFHSEQLHSISKAIHLRRNNLVCLPCNVRPRFLLCALFFQRRKYGLSDIFKWLLLLLAALLFKAPHDKSPGET
jgi:hypothetical protein